MSLACESREADVEEAHLAVSGGILSKLLLVVGGHQSVGVSLPGCLGPSILLEEYERIFHPVDPTNVADVDRPSPGVVGTHGEQVFEDLAGGGVWIAPH